MDLAVPNKIQLLGYKIERQWLGWPKALFVANVNVNSDGNRKVNVNRFENANVWNADNRHRLVVPPLTISPAIGGSFADYVFSPAA